MRWLPLLVKLLPFLAFLAGGIHSILEVLFPVLRGPDYKRWEIDDNSGSYVQILGWTKVIRPPRVIAQGYMSDRAAAVAGIFAGVICILIGALGIRHIGGFPAFLPDLVAKYW